MGEAFTTFLDTVKNGEFGFDKIFAFIADLWASIFANEHIIETMDWINSIIAVVVPYLPYILIALSAILLLFGKRLFGLLQFLTFFVVGYLLGVFYLTDLVVGFIPSIPAFAIGLAVGLVAAVLGRLLYIIAYIVCAGYSVYLVCISGMVLPEIAGNYMVALIVAAIAIVLALLLRKIIERLGTAFLGALGILTIVRSWYDFTALVPGQEVLVFYVACGVLALIGFAVQQATRKKKY